MGKQPACMSLRPNQRKSRTILVIIFVIIVLALVTYQSMVWTKRKLFPWEAA
jgi:ABC-type nitrate/sulfonate/bicarbonate transport system permease component